MPIRCRLSTLMGERKLHQTDVVRGAGVSKGVVYDLYHEKTRMVAFDTLERLCRFFNCDVGDILKYVPDDQEERR